MEKKHEMNGTVSVSIIMPAYNPDPEPFDRCIKSILEQSLADFELLIADDGSDEEALERIRAYENRDPRIKVIRTKHGGVSAARNAGLRKAEGKYITFADDDDLLPPEWLGHAFALAEEYSADIVLGSIIAELDPYNIPPRKPGKANFLKPDETDTVRALAAYLYRSEPRLPELKIECGIYSKLFRREIACSISFPEELRLSEDQVYMVRAILASKRFVLTDETAYHYLIYPDSVTHVPIPDALGQQLRSVHMMRDDIDLSPFRNDPVICRSFDFRALENALLGLLAVNKEPPGSLKYYIKEETLLRRARRDPLVKHAMKHLPADEMRSWLWRTQHHKMLRSLPGIEYYRFFRKKVRSYLKKRRSRKNAGA